MKKGRDITDKFKIGIYGVGRGLDIADDILLNGCEIVAFCDFNKERLANVLERFGDTVKVFDDFDDFINMDMDAVVLANFFTEHAPYAVKCFKKGLSVYSECISNVTMAEGVELIREFEKSDCIYMLAENYPYMIFNREMKRVCDGGTLGKLLFAEGEYNHPVSEFDVEFKKKYIYFEKHWRNYIPSTYYITHSLSPIMWMTGAVPKKVSAFATFAPAGESEPTASFVGDRAAIIITQNDDGSVFRVTGWAQFGAHDNSYRVCGTNGQIENLRGKGNEIMLRYNDWCIPDGMCEINSYEPSWNDEDAATIANSGHGGGDFLAFREFVRCLREKKQPESPFDIYSSVTMASVAILGHRSVLDGGKVYDVPDFHEEKSRKQYENDRLTPFYDSEGNPPTLPCCSHNDYKPNKKQLELYRGLIES